METNDTEVVETAQVEEPKVEELEVKEPTAGELKIQLEQVRRDLTTAQEEAKAHQKFGTKAKAELEKQRKLDGRLDSLESTLKVLVEMQAESLDNAGEGDLEGKQRKSEQFTKRLRDGEADRVRSEQQALLSIAQEADGLLKSVGMDMESDEALKAYNLFLKGKPEAGLDEVKKLVTAKKEAGTNKETEEVRIERLANERFNKLLKDKGLDFSDTGLPAGGGGGIPTERSKLNDWIEAMPQAEYERRKPEIDAMLASGKIK